MRVQVSAWLQDVCSRDSQSIFLTGDLGYNAFEGLQQKIGERFINAGVSEQNMISMAAALAREGLKPFCYSIAPFAVFRPAEQIRLDVAIHDLNVKLIGNGGGYGYGIMGATHHALEDLAFLSSLPHFSCYAPVSNEDLTSTAQAFYQDPHPGYLRLGLGVADGLGLELGNFAEVRRLKSGDQLTVVGLGPVLLNAVKAATALEANADVFAIGRLPWSVKLDEILSSVRRTKRLLIVEEHVKRGGMGEALLYELMSEGAVPDKFRHAFAQGYPNGLYGSQLYHQKISGLDVDGIKRLMKELT